MKLVFALAALLISATAFAQNFTFLPENIEPDTDHAPFYHGIVSDDSLQTGSLSGLELPLKQFNQPINHD